MSKTVCYDLVFEHLNTLVRVLQCLKHTILGQWPPIDEPQKQVSHVAITNEFKNFSERKCFEVWTITVIQY